MRLEAIQAEPVEPKPIPQMLTKKKNLLLAGQIVNAGAESLRKSLNVSWFNLKNAHCVRVAETRLVGGEEKRNKAK